MQLFISKLLTLTFILIEFAFYLKLKYCAKNFFRSKISPKDFQVILENDYTSTHNWAEKIKWSLGRQKNINEISAMIYEHLSDGLDKINFFTNIAPAVGLLSTFIGMFTILIFLKKDMQPQDVPPLLSNIAPICIGSLVGILVYIYGNHLKRKLSDQLNKKTEEYLSVYLEVEKNIFLNDPRNIEEWADIFRKILKPLSGLIKRLNEVNDNFDIFNKRMEIFNGDQINHLEAFNQSVKTLEECTSNNIKILHSSFSNFNNNITDLLGRIAVLSSSNENYNNNLVKVNESLEKTIGRWNEIGELINSFKSIERIVVELDGTATAINAATDKIFTQNKSIFELIEELKKYTTAVDGYNIILGSIKDQVQILSQQFPKLQDVRSLIDSSNNIVIKIGEIHSLIKDSKMNPETLFIPQLLESLTKINENITQISISHNKSLTGQIDTVEIVNMSGILSEVRKSLNEISITLVNLRQYIEKLANKNVYYKIYKYVDKIFKIIKAFIYRFKVK